MALQFDDGVIENYELVEVDRPDRRRGNEYAALAAAGHPIYHVPSEDWTTAEQALNWIHEMVKKKIKKAKELADKDISYPNQTFLLLYININDFGTISEEINDKIPLVTESAKGWFSSGWVLWNDRAYQV